MTTRSLTRNVPEWAIHAFVWALLVVKDVIQAYTNPTFPIPKNALLTHWLVLGGYVLISAAAFYGAVWLVARPLQDGPLRWQTVLLALLGLVGTSVGVTVVRYGLEFGVFKPVLGYDNYSRNNAFTLTWFVQNSVRFYYNYLIYGLLYAFVRRNILTERQQRDTEQARTAVELAFLQSQLNPHFLFNTINDIYALVYRQAPEAPAALLKLSELLRYVLHESRHDRVLLAKELDYVNGLIELQRIGTKGNVHVDYARTGTLAGQPIAPMLLVSFVENAFKHGVSNDPAQPIRFALHLTDDTLTVLISNVKNHAQKDQTGGIGLANVRRRLALLYPNRHQLQIQDEADSFSVSLQLRLN